jgi:two-component system sensor histidine kinase KdpD
METKRLSRKASITAAVASVVFITLVFRVIAMMTAISIVNATTVGFTYLIVILLVAASWGITESVVASVVATIFFNYYFLPPIGNWAIADPENWVAMFAFLITSLIASELSDLARRRTVEANTGKLEMERLYELSREILAMEEAEHIGDRIANELARICEIPAVAIYDSISDLIHRGGVEQIFEVETALKDTARTGVPSKDDESRTIVAPISLGGRTTGSVAIRGIELSNTALHALLNLVAITLENARSRAIVTRAQAARQSEEFKSTLLDGLAHEFKTPLTSIRAVTTALLASNVSDAAQQHELLTIVDQEAERLSRLVTEATRVARIEAGKIHVNREWHGVNELIRGILAQMEGQFDGRRLDLSIAASLPPVFVDADLIQLALRQLVDNALKYSPRTSAIQIGSELGEGNIFIAVRNEGESLSESESARVFDKFYRGRNVRHQVAGTGMGLPVARDILLAHGGDIQLTNSNRGCTEFVMRIPTSDAKRECDSAKPRGR